MNDRKKWIKHEIDKLSKLYEAKTSLKEIARVLDRSCTSVNKALDRYQIRLPRTLKVKPQNRLKKVSKPRLKACEKTKRDPRLVNITVIIRYLQENGYSVSKTYCLVHPYKINGIPKTLGQVLIICNKHRLTHGQDIFLLPDFI